MSDQPEEKPKAPPAIKAKTSKVLLLLLLINTGGTGFVAYQGMEQAAVMEEMALSAPGAEHKEEKPKDEIGPVTQLDPFIVNLNEPDATRYLKATFELEVSGTEVIGMLEKQKRVVRDEVLRFLSSLSVADTQGEVGKSKIQKEVVARIDKQLGGNKVRRLFFVDFVVQ